MNEAEGLEKHLKYLNRILNKTFILEIIIVDGGSIDATRSLAKKQGVRVLISEKGRAIQMNCGAKHAKGDILYFLHADTYPPQAFEYLICQATAKGFEAGCFRMKFDTQNPVLQFFAYLTRINHIICRGGDQSLFITKNAFLNSGGFNENYQIYEDVEFIKRLYKRIAFTVIPKPVITSSRRYRKKGWLNVQFHFAIIHLKHYLGAKPEKLYDYYQKRLL